jgi:DNA-binding NarL/FixJ family response regulator
MHATREGNAMIAHQLADQRSRRSVSPLATHARVGPQSAPVLPAELATLTAREIEIGRLVAKGFSNKEVGRLLEISHWTVAAHLKAMFLKLGVRRRVELAYSLRGMI